MPIHTLKKIRIVGDGRLTKVFDADTGEEIRHVQRVEFEQAMLMNGLRGRPLVKLTILAVAQGIDVVGETLMIDESDLKAEIDAAVASAASD